jgi:hypothetical protein
MNLWIISWLVKPLYSIKDWVITRVKSFAFPPPTTHYHVKRTCILFHVCLH